MPTYIERQVAHTLREFSRLTRLVQTLFIAGPCADSRSLDADRPRLPGTAKWFANSAHRAIACRSPPCQRGETFRSSFIMKSLISHATLNAGARKCRGKKGAPGAILTFSLWTAERLRVKPEQISCRNKPLFVIAKSRALHACFAVTTMALWK